MNAKLESVLKKRTFNMFNEKWYKDTINEIISKGQDFKGYVYFVSNGYSNSIKIGKSSSVNNRLNSFNTTFPSGVFLWGFIYNENYDEIEKLLHSFFESKKITNEWFSLSYDDFKDIEEKYDFILTNGFFKKDSKIIDGLKFNITAEEIKINKKYDGINLFMDNLDFNKVYYNAKIRLDLADFNPKFKDWSPKKIIMTIKKWAEFNGINIKFKKDEIGRCFILNN
jgi:hypothetical protein